MLWHPELFFPCITSLLHRFIDELKVERSTLLLTSKDQGWVCVIFPTNKIEMAHLRMNGCAGRALPSKWSLQSSQTIKINHSSPSKAVEDGVWIVVGGLGDGWQVAGKIRTNQCEGAAFCKIEKVTKLKAERGTSRWLQTLNSTPARQLSLEWSVEKGLVKLKWVLVEWKGVIEWKCVRP